MLPTLARGGSPIRSDPPCRSATVDPLECVRLQLADGALRLAHERSQHCRSDEKQQRRGLEAPPTKCGPALNLVTRVSDTSRSCAGVHYAQRSGRTGRNGRSGYCRGCCQRRDRALCRLRGEVALVFGLLVASEALVPRIGDMRLARATRPEIVPRACERHVWLRPAVAASKRRATHLRGLRTTRPPSRGPR